MKMRDDRVFEGAAAVNADARLNAGALDLFDE